MSRGETWSRGVGESDDEKKIRAVLNLKEPCFKGGGCTPPVEIPNLRVLDIIDVICDSFPDKRVSHSASRSFEFGMEEGLGGSAEKTLRRGYSAGGCLEFKSGEC